MTTRLSGDPAALLLSIYATPEDIARFRQAMGLNDPLELGRILESTLSFLGLGVQSPDISWGQTLAAGRLYIATAWWVSGFAGLAIALLVLAVNAVGDWLAEVLDPSVRML